MTAADETAKDRGRQVPGHGSPQRRPTRRAAIAADVLTNGRVIGLLNGT
jgi:hypothetical protein